jgi:hypothetical protein
MKSLKSLLGLTSLEKRSKTNIGKKKIQVTYTIEENHPTPADEKEKNVA